MGCWVIEVACKYLFADLEPKSMVTKGRERREQRRLIEEQEKSKSQAEEDGSEYKSQAEKDGSDLKVQ